MKKDFTEFSKTISELQRIIDHKKAECLKETGMRYDDKALEEACEYISNATGSCPYYREGWYCVQPCEHANEPWICWMKYFREKG